MTDYSPGRRQRRPPQGRRPRTDPSATPAPAEGTESEERTTFDSSARRSWVVAPSGDREATAGPADVPGDAAVPPVGRGSGSTADGTSPTGTSPRTAHSPEPAQTPGSEPMRVRTVPGRSTSVGPGSTPVRHTAGSAEDTSGTATDSAGTAQAAAAADAAAEPPTTPLAPMPGERRGRRAGPPRDETRAGPVLPGAGSAGEVRGRHGSPGHHRGDPAVGDEVDAWGAVGVSSAGSARSAGSATSADGAADVARADGTASAARADGAADAARAGSADTAAPADDASAGTTPASVPADVDGPAPAHAAGTIPHDEPSAGTRPIGVRGMRTRGTGRRRRTVSPRTRRRSPGRPRPPQAPAPAQGPAQAPAGHRTAPANAPWLPTSRVPTRPARARCRALRVGRC
jgi:hypothetical protein